MVTTSRGFFYTVYRLPLRLSVSDLFWSSPSLSMRCFKHQSLRCSKEVQFDQTLPHGRIRNPESMDASLKKPATLCLNSTGLAGQVYDNLTGKVPSAPTLRFRALDFSLVKFLVSTGWLHHKKMA